MIRPRFYPSIKLFGVKIDSIIVALGLAKLLIRDITIHYISGLIDVILIAHIQGL